MNNSEHFYHNNKLLSIEDEHYILYLSDLVFTIPTIEIRINCNIIYIQK